MFVDISEIKSLRDCPRKHQLSSRNGMHLRPTEVPLALITGTVFHRGLEMLYIGHTVNDVMEMLDTDAPDASIITLRTMLKGYAGEKGPLDADLDMYTILGTEVKFSFPLVDTNTGEVHEDIRFVGSIDMVAQHKQTGLIYGFEHKSAKTFRSEIYLFMDEQPRMYQLALQHMYPDHAIGGVYMNEVKKLVRDFQYKRSLVVFDETDLSNFLRTITANALTIYGDYDGTKASAPTPSYMGCLMCSFGCICSEMGFKWDSHLAMDIARANDIEPRITDHLEDK